MSALKFLMKGRAASAVNIEDVFSAYTRSGTGAEATITVGFQPDLVWTKSRSAATGNRLADSATGFAKELITDSTAAQAAAAQGIKSVTSTAYVLGTDTDYNDTTGSATYVDWAFKKQANFFDIVTYTGNGSNRTIAHSLGSVPGMIMIKDLTSANAWKVYHRSLTSNAYHLVLNTTAAEVSDATVWNSTTATASVFSLGTHADVNTNTNSYVAYLFAHDTSSTGLIQCGSLVGTGSPVSVTLNWEPQFVLIKRIDNVTAGAWEVTDTTRGMPNTGVNQESYVLANTSAAESVSGYWGIRPTATGFVSDSVYNAATYIYLAIRRGPMAQPTAGTQVYNAVARTGTGAAATVTGVGFPPDLVSIQTRNNTNGRIFSDRLRGSILKLKSYVTDAEASVTDSVVSLNMDGMSLGADSSDTLYQVNGGNTHINHVFRRYPGVFDIVCYTGTGANATVAHNLTVPPELVIVKGRSGATSWFVGELTNGFGYYSTLNTTNDSRAGATVWNSTSPTATVFSLGSGSSNDVSATYVAYLFATKAGVSKVFSYTGDGTSGQTINCGFAAGARFVMIKRTDASSVGDWFMWDSTRGIVAGNDGHLSLNTTAAEVTSDDTIDTDNSGFIVNQVAATNVNVTSATYIGIAFS